MKVLWVINQCIPAIARDLNIEVPNKEGWLTGLSERILEDKENKIELSVFFNTDYIHSGLHEDSDIKSYGYCDEVEMAWEYDYHLERELGGILKRFNPDIVHIFGTEYPHTLAVCRAFNRPERTLIGIQGLCSVYAKHYFDGLPDDVINGSTLRDRLKNDNIKEQQKKFVLRGQNEIEAIKLAGNITGRTDWDRKHTSEINPDAEYYFMNETLRSVFYDGKWDFEKCEKYSLFASQGDYPIKGLHVLLKALPKIKKDYPDVKLYVSGNKITGEDSFKKKILIGSYGRYILKLIKEGGLEENVVFLGSLDASGMKERFLKSNAFISPSMMENSPNSVGEAMLLSMPVITSDVGGVRNLLSEEEGFIYPSLDEDMLVRAVKKCFEANGSDAQKTMCEKAGKKARITHDADTNYKRLLEIYESIAGK